MRLALATKSSVTLDQATAYNLVTLDPQIKLNPEDYIGKKATSTIHKSNCLNFNKHTGTYFQDSDMLKFQLETVTQTDITKPANLNLKCSEDRYTKIQIPNLIE